MAEKARLTLLKIYGRIAKYRFAVYAASLAFALAYVIKSIIRMRSAGILGFLLPFAAIILIAALLPFFRFRLFAFGYIIELVTLPLLAAVLIILMIAGFAAEDELIGIISCTVTAVEAIYSKKISQHESDF